MFEERIYDAETAKFLGRDPIGELGGVNITAIVGNDPINYFDALGLEKYVLIYEARDPIFGQWADHIKGLIEAKGTTIYGNDFRKYDKKCDEIVRLPVQSHDDALKVKDYKDVRYIASFGHGSPGILWYNVGEGMDFRSLVFQTAGVEPKNKMTARDPRPLSAFGGVKFARSAFAELYHCYTRVEVDQAGTTVAGVLQSTWGIPIYGSKNGIDNGQWYNRGYPTFHTEKSGNDKNPNYGGFDPNTNTSPIPPSPEPKK